MAATATVSIGGNEMISNAMPSTSIVGRSARNVKAYSITAMYLSMSADAKKDIEVEDELALAQRQLQSLKTQISTESKKNFILERDVRYLDSRIALLIQNRMALDEQNALASQLADAQDLQERSFPDNRMLQCYGNLFFLLQAEPRHIATLCRLVSLAEIDSLLQTVMFTIYGNQYESREEHLLLTMFQSVLSAQVDNTLQFSSLLRANTPVSRMMTTYTRRGPGQTYLKLVLSDVINSVLEDVDTNLEVNPLKVYEEVIEASEKASKSSTCLPRSVSMEIAAETYEVQNIIHPRLVQLQSITSTILNTILERVDQVPYGIRWICKQIRNLTRRKYPDAGEEAHCILIGGFFFLRYINPAIITPQAYMLVDHAPVDNPRRTLTLVQTLEGQY